MRTAVDTNVLSALWSKEALGLDIARNLGNAKTEGGLVVGAPVYAELLGSSEGYRILCERLSRRYRHRRRFRVSTIRMAGGRPPFRAPCKAATKDCTPRSQAFEIGRASCRERV